MTRLIKQLKRYGVLTALLVLPISCSKPIEPESSDSFTYALQVDVSDTVIFNVSYRSIRFSKRPGTWPSQELLNGPVVIKVSRLFEDTTEQFDTIGIWIDEAEQSGRHYIYQENKDFPIDTLQEMGNVVLDAINPNDQSDFRYAVSAILVKEGAGGIDYVAELQNGPFYSRLVTLGAGKIPSRLSINKGAKDVENIVVELSGVLDTAGVSRYIIYSYSAINPLLSSNILLSLYGKYGNKDNVDTAGFTLFGTRKHYYWVSDSVTKSYGLIQKTDTVNRNDLAAYFSLQGDSGTSLVAFTRQDTLVPYMGTKWVAIKAENSIKNPFLSANASIRPYYASLKIDSKDAKIVRDGVLPNNVCLLSDEIPIAFHTYNDPSFDDTVQIWIATRKLKSSFSGGLSQYSFTGAFAAEPFFSDNSLNKWPDCIYETVPEKVVLNSFGEFRGTILKDFDYQSGYRISPLCGLLMTGADYKTASFQFVDVMGQFLRIEADSFSLNRIVKPGSILGYEPVYFQKQRILLASSLDTVSAIGWHMASNMLEIQSYPSLSDYIAAKFGISERNKTIYHSILADCVPDLEGRLYQHPMRGLPISSSSVMDGKKEFILLAYAKGRYFQEPRVILSRFNTNEIYFWDKISPEFCWIFKALKEPIWDPLISPIYAPLCTDNFCSDLSLLNRRFDVYLSDKSVLNKWCSMRDAGFGQIKSARLLFNYRDNFVESKPVTLVREYLTPNIPVNIPQNKIDGQ